MFRRVFILALSLFAVPACDDAEELIDLPEKLKTLDACMEPVWDQMSEIATEISKLYEADPDDFYGNFTINDTTLGAGQTSISVTVTLTSGTMDVTIRFYNDDGSPFAADLTGYDPSTDSIDAIMDAVATQMGQSDPQDQSDGVPDPADTRPFMIAEWTLSNGLTGGGNMCGVIGGADSSPANSSNELQELRTTQATPAGGIPPIAPATLGFAGANSACSATFTINSLITDQTFDEGDDSLPPEYPDGDVFITIEGPGSKVDVTIAFNGPADPVAVVTVQGVPGQGTIDLSTEPPTVDFGGFG